MMDRGTFRNMQSFIPKNKFEKLAHLVGFIIRIYHSARLPERQTGECVNAPTKLWLFYLTESV